MVVQFDLELLWLVPAALAVGFMLWTLWNLHKQIRHETRFHGVSGTQEHRSLHARMQQR
jgi:hypothetical protein